MSDATPAGEEAEPVTDPWSAGMMSSMFLVIALSELARPPGVGHVVAVAASAVSTVALTWLFVVAARKIGVYLVGAVWGVAIMEANVAAAAPPGALADVLGTLGLQAMCIAGGAIVGVWLAWFFGRYGRHRADTEAMGG